MSLGRGGGRLKVPGVGACWSREVPQGLLLHTLANYDVDYRGVISVEVSLRSDVGFEMQSFMRQAVGRWDETVTQTRQPTS